MLDLNQLTQLTHFNKSHFLGVASLEKGGGCIVGPEIIAEQLKLLQIKVVNVIIIKHLPVLLLHILASRNLKSFFKMIDCITIITLNSCGSNIFHFPRCYSHLGPTMMP